MTNLYYIESETRLVWIPNYYTTGTGIVSDIIKNLDEGEKKIRDFLPDARVYSQEVTNSTWCKGKWIFQAVCPPANKPSEAYLVSDKSMAQWLKG